MNIYNHSTLSFALAKLHNIYIYIYVCTCRRPWFGLSLNLLSITLGYYFGQTTGFFTISFKNKRKKKSNLILD